MLCGLFCQRFVVCLTLFHLFLSYLVYFVLVYIRPFSISITSFGEGRANLSAFRMFDRFVLVWICRFPLPLDVWKGLRFVIVALPGLFSYLFFSTEFEFLFLATPVSWRFVVFPVWMSSPGLGAGKDGNCGACHFWCFGLIPGL